MYTEAPGLGTLCAQACFTIISRGCQRSCLYIIPPLLLLCFFFYFTTLLHARFFSFFGPKLLVSGYHTRWNLVFRCLRRLIMVWVASGYNFGSYSTFIWVRVLVTTISLVTWLVYPLFWRCVGYRSNARERTLLLLTQTQTRSFC
ncbi:hypothetical protein EJ02DRAFT_192308 [Clathrospora elynae]|uniref:Uncharacterized protein n=1 Tax=Clathrospora elynae TaxID=706981 RepID=A0A6A5SPI5_9PLEO|nr:hypothetical protein EJ02DRAFT_192308 [Clathrospora elynae]